MVCGSEISPVTFDGNAEKPLHFSKKNERMLTRAKCGNLSTKCNQLFIIVRTANQIFAGSGGKLWLEMFGKRSGVLIKDELVSVGGFSPNRTYGFVRPAHQLPGNLSIESVKSINLETDNFDALHLTDVFVFGRNTDTEEFTVFAFSCDIEQSKQWSQQDGEGVKSLRIPVVKSFDQESCVFST